MNRIKGALHSKPSKRQLKHSFLTFLLVAFGLWFFFAMASSSKKTRGKQKIEIKIIENEDDRLISFSKRHFGIYKKISELSTLCGYEILFIIFSPKAKHYSFAHPSIKSVTKRFLNPNQPLYETTDAPVEAYRKSSSLDICRKRQEDCIHFLNACCNG
ncbi:hypothetical protein Goari_025790 [Gossypium aridum]|uniref:MADS-box domain-containing protein n=1 Tax=Gossypium aridum TaxID=34290 RepID=A0A7J8XA85_GOSAI|nr:hypothetical protein [Gossypium aridum]